MLSVRILYYMFKRWCGFAKRNLHIFFLPMDPTAHVDIFHIVFTHHMRHMLCSPQDPSTPRLQFYVAADSGAMLEEVRAAITSRSTGSAEGGPVVASMSPTLIHQCDGPDRRGLACQQVPTLLAHGYTSDLFGSTRARSNFD